MTDVQDDTRRSNHSGTMGLVLVTSADQLSYLQTMTAGAVSRTMAQTLLHPAHTYKTLLQLRPSSPTSLAPSTFSTPLSPSLNPSLSRLLRGVDAQFVLSLPHGAFHFFVIDFVKQHLHHHLHHHLNYLHKKHLLHLQHIHAITDFISCSVSTIVCSIVSTPQMVLTDRLMAGVYETFPEALRKIYRSEGVAGFYAGWWPALAQKIPSYALTYVFFQQLKHFYIENVLERRSANAKSSTTISPEMNFVLGAVAAAASVTVMIPMDTIKTRLVVQTAQSIGAAAAGSKLGSVVANSIAGAGAFKPYKGVADCFVRIVQEEGVGALYKSLPPRLMSVVPMIAIQFGVYEGLKSQFIVRNVRERMKKARQNAMKAVHNNRRSFQQP
eukprot:gene25059-30267_t